jgi:mRNA interferase RelE/StbE
MDTGNVFKIIESNNAKKYIQRQNKEFGERVEEAYKEIKKDPINPLNKMGGFKNRYRYRFGDYRIVYEVSLKEIIIFIINVNPRGDVYK